MTSFESPLDIHQSVRPNRKPLSWPWRLARIACVALGLLTLVAALGAGYERLANAGDAASYPLSGRMVDVGGYALHLDCRGQGTPTVVMDAGLGASSLDWALVQPEVSRDTQVCTYDRAGMGWSETGPAPRTPSHLAEELHTLLHNGGVPGPYILVGHSLAGKTIRLFAASHPAEVAGMVLIDARSELVEANADMQTFAAALDAQALEYSVARTLGLARLFGGQLIGLASISPDLATQMALFETAPSAIAETTQEGLNRTADDVILANTSLGTMPLAVIAAGESMANLPGWPEAQRSMAQLSTNGHLIVAEGGGHAVHLEEPTVVINAIDRVIEDVRDGR